jgi:hypothetical protein
MKKMSSSRSWSLETLVVFGAVGLATGFSGCSPGGDVAPVTTGLAADPNAINGEIKTYVADFEDGRSERWFALRQADGRELRLEFDATPTVTAGQRVWLRGTLLGDKTLHVTDMELAATLETEHSSALTSTDPEVIAAPATDSYVLVLVDLGAGVNMTAAQAQARLTSTIATDRSFASYYNESSYGKYNVTGTVLGPLAFTMTTCDTTGMASALEGANPAIAASNHVIYYFNRSALCTFGGLGEEGSTARPSRRTWMNGSLTCVVLMQEPGHNLGLMHANTMNCNGATFSTTPMTGCTITEYGSQLTTMGGGCRTLNGYERWYMQWMAGCNGVKVPAGGTFNLLPLDNSCPGGIQVLQVPFPAARTVNDPQATTTVVNLRNYYLELRTQTGNFDTYTTGTARAGATVFSGPTVFIYVSDDVHIPTATGRGGGQNSVWTELVNTIPTGTAYAGLSTVGQTFVDPAGAGAGPTITLRAISATGATIEVANPVGTGSPTCMDGTALAGSGPAACGAVTGLGGTTGADGGAGLGGATGAGGARGLGGAPGGAGGASGTAGASGAAGARGTDAGTVSGAGGTTAGGGVVGPGGASGTVDAGGSEVGGVTGGCGCNVPAGNAPVWSGIAGAIALALLRRRRPGR